jgi:hypothetical protein
VESPSVIIQIEFHTVRNNPARTDQGIITPSETNLESPNFSLSLSLQSDYFALGLA